MAQRYGRNQKRKHRERIAELEEREVTLGKRITRLNERLERANEWDQDIRRLLGPESALRLETQQWDLDVRDHDDVMKYSMPVFFKNLEYGPQPFDYISHRIIFLHKIMTEIRKDPEGSGLRHLIKLHCRSKGKTSCIMVSDEYIQKMKSFTAQDRKILLEAFLQQLEHHFFGDKDAS